MKPVVEEEIKKGHTDSIDYSSYHVETTLKHGPIKIKAAYYHPTTTIRWPGVCGNESTISVNKMPGIKMSMLSLDSPTIILECKGRWGLVAVTNFSLIDLEYLE